MVRCEVSMTDCDFSRRWCQTLFIWRRTLSLSWWASLLCRWQSGSAHHADFHSAWRERRPWVGPDRSFMIHLGYINSFTNLMTGGLVNGVFLLSVCFFIFLEAIQRFISVPSTLVRPPFCFSFVPNHYFGRRGGKPSVGGLRSVRRARHESDWTLTVHGFGTILSRSSASY